MRAWDTAEASPLYLPAWLLDNCKQCLDFLNHISLNIKTYFIEVNVVYEAAAFM